MRIQIDIAHPAHIHYFRNFVKLLEDKGHTCLLTLRDREPIVELAKSYNLPFKIRSTKEDERVHKAYYALTALKNIYKISRYFNPDIYLDMGTVFASPIAKLRGKPYIAFDDTEASVKARALHMPFTNCILTPSSFRLNLGRKHIKFNSFMELCYLHPKFRIYKFENEIKQLLGQNYVVLRFISWEAHHDSGQSGLNLDSKYKLIEALKKKYDVFISSENQLDLNLNDYLLPTKPEQIHEVLTGAKLFITEGATMATEAALLGTPVIYCNTIVNGNTEELSNYGILHISTKYDYIITTINKLESLDAKSISQRILSDKIDITSFMVWFVEHYPESVRVMRENPDYQWRFR